MEKISSINADQGTGIKIGGIFKNVVIALIMTAILLMLASFVVTNTQIPEHSIRWIVLFASALSVFAAGLSTSRRARAKGLINGALTALIYIILLYVAGLLAFGSPAFDSGSLTTIIIVIAAGALGGVIGVNTHRKRR